MGEPRLYPATDRCPVHIYDSEGLTTSSEPQKKLLKDFIHSRRIARDSKGLEEDIHVVWWVVDAATSRIDQDGVASFARDVLAGTITILILNKCDLATTETLEKIERDIEVQLSWLPACAHFK